MEGEEDREQERRSCHLRFIDFHLGCTEEEPEEEEEEEINKENRGLREICNSSQC